MRTFTAMWDEICRTRYGVEDAVAAPISLRRAGQLTRTHRAAAREQRPAHRARDARASRSRPTPARAPSSCRRGTKPSASRDPGTSSGACASNRCSPSRATCSSTPTSSRAPRSWRPWCTSSPLAAQSELDDVLALGGAFAAIDELKSATRREPVRARRAHRVRRTDRRRRQPLHRDRRVAPHEWRAVEAIMTSTRRSSRQLIENVARVARRTRRGRGARGARRTAPRRREHDARRTTSWCRPSRSRRPGGTTGEWADALREVFGELPSADRRARRRRSNAASTSPTLVARSKALGERRGTPPKLLVAKLGLDGHSNGAEQIAVAARDAGFEVIYQGIRLSPEEIVAAARDEDVDVVGLSILSGSHLALVPADRRGTASAGSSAKVVVGGIVPDEDARTARVHGRGGRLHAEGLRHGRHHGRPLGPRRGVDDLAVDELWATTRVGTGVEPATREAPRSAPCRARDGARPATALRRRPRAPPSPRARGSDGA